MLKTHHDFASDFEALNPGVRIFPYSCYSIGVILERTQNHMLLHIPDGYKWADNGTSIVSKDKSHTKYEVIRFEPSDFPECY